MCLKSKAKNSIVLLLFGSGTEWHEFSMAAILYGYATWCLVFGEGFKMALGHTAGIMPPIAWACWFGSVATLKTTGLFVQHTRLRIIGSWLGTLTWAFLWSQFIPIETTNWLGFPTFAALTVTNGWLVIRNAILMDREKRGHQCKPSSQ